MKESRKNNQQAVTELKKILANNPDADFLTLSLQNEENLSQLNWKGFEKKKEECLEHIKAYQRLIRIIPKEQWEMAFILMENGFRSATQIAALSKKTYLQQVGSSLKNKPEVADTIYNNALLKRSRLVVQYMDVLQNNEPHVKAARI